MTKRVPILCLLLVLYACLLQPVYAEEIGRVTAVSGDVRLNPQGENRPLRVGDAIAATDVVVTGTDGHVTIELQDGAAGARFVVRLPAAAPHDPDRSSGDLVEEPHLDGSVVTEVEVEVVAVGHGRSVGYEAFVPSGRYLRADGVAVAEGFGDSDVEGGGVEGAEKLCRGGFGVEA